jgi:CBS domain-containing protein
MHISDILNKDERQLITARPEDTVETAASRLSDHNIGACPVRDESGQLVGVLSERDIVRAFATSGGKVLTLRVRDLMTRDVATCKPDDEVRAAKELMSRRHVRHLPVVADDGAVIAMLSMRDVIECHLEQAQLEMNVLRDYAIARA